MNLEPQVIRSINEYRRRIAFNKITTLAPLILGIAASLVMIGVSLSRGNSRRLVR